MPFKKYQKEIFIISLLITLVLVFLVIKPFLPAVILGAVIAYLFYPVFEWFERRLKNKQLCAIITMLIITLIFTIPVVLVFKSIIGEVSVFYLRENNADVAASNLRCDGEDMIACRLDPYLLKIIPSGYMRESLNATLSVIYGWFLDVASTLFFSIPYIIFNLLIIVFVIFYLFADWKWIVKELDSLLPFREDVKKAFAKQVRDIIHATVYGTLIVALIQGAIGAIAFMILDSTRLPLFWGIIMSIAALIPFIGTALVWLPLGLIQVVTGYEMGSTAVMWKGVILLSVGMFIISTIDNVIKPKIIGHRAAIHPLLVLLGILGGLSFFGYIGVIVGPLLMALLVTFVRVYQKEKNAIVG